MRNKIKDLWRRIKDFFSPAATKKHTPKMDYTYPPGSALGALLNPLSRLSDMYIPIVTEEQFRLNMQRLELARLEQDRESTNNNLKAQHRALIITTVATLVALLSAGVAVWVSIHNKPPVVNVQVKPSAAKPPVVNVQPNVIIKQ